MKLEIVLHILILIVVSARIVFLLFKVGKSIALEDDSVSKSFVFEQVFWGLLYFTMSSIIIANLDTTKSLDSNFRPLSVIALIGAIIFTMNSENDPENQMQRFEIGLALIQICLLFRIFLF